MRRLLLVTFHFPPRNAIAAVRTGKFARYLIAQGWDVRVIAADAPTPETLPPEIRDDRVLRAPCRATRAYGATGAGPARDEPSSLRRRLGMLRAAVCDLPDSHRRWRREAHARADRFLGAWRPDIVYASAPPASALLVARILARRLGVPWIAEFRDLWTGNPYYEFPAWRRRLEASWERRVVRDAAALVTVSATWRDALRAAYGKPVVLAMNGFAPEDMPPDLPAEAQAGETLRILHTGTIYPGFRDPAPLFAAVARLGERRGAVEIAFAGEGLGTVADSAAAAGIADRVRILPPVAHREALRLQSRADILLHLQWNDPREAGTISGKLFEYLGARRPVLGLGYEHGEVARLLHAHGRGIVLNDPETIAARLRLWIDRKRTDGIAPLAAASVSGLTRDAQFAAAARLAATVADRAPAQAPPPFHRDPTGMRASRLYAPAAIDPREPPRLCVAVDTEEQFDWRAPFSRHNVCVSAIDSLHLAQSLCERHGLRPAYLLDHPVATSPRARDLIGGWLCAGRCEIGAQLHPWVNPPHAEEASPAHSFPGNLPPWLERAKLETLGDAIAEGFGVRPRIYKAGRYGLGASTAAILEALGYAVDTSVLPHTDLRFKGGPDMRGFDAAPFLFGAARALREWPVTRGYIGRATSLGARLFPLAEGETRLPGIARGALARSGLVDRVTLTPEGIGLAQMKALTRALLARGQRVFVLSFHSPSLEPGHTPYVADAAARAALRGLIDAYLDCFLGELGGAPATPLGLHARFAGAPPVQEFP
ncbi:MAG: glycosyltransferase [Rhodospirillales bacterium]